MSSYSTKKNSIQSRAGLITVLAFILSTLVFYSCSTSQENIYKDSNTGDELNGNKKALSFSTKQDGKVTYWKAEFEDGKISALFRNGEKVSPADIDKFKDMVYDNVDELTSDDRVYERKHFLFDEEGRDEEPGGLHDVPDSIDFDFHFDKEALEKSMKDLKDYLECLKDRKFEFHFDTAQFNKNMRHLKEGLQNMKLDLPDFECDMGALKDNMKKFRHEHFYNGDFEKDMSRFKEEMEKFKDKMKDFKFEMKGFKEKMKKFGAFMKELKHEMVKDGLIQNEDEEINLKFNSNEMRVNGKKVPDNLFEKYKKMYKDYSGKSIDDGINLRTCIPRF